MWRYCEKIPDVIWYCESQCERNSAHIVTHIVRRLWTEMNTLNILLCINKHSPFSYSRALHLKTHYCSNHLKFEWILKESKQGKKRTVSGVLTENTKRSENWISSFDLYPPHYLTWFHSFACSCLAIISDSIAVLGFLYL